MNNIRYFILIIILMLFTGCSNENGNRLNFEEKGRNVPSFNADSAYQFVEKQISFGPRNPNSEGHEATKNYLLKKLKKYAGDQRVFAQDFTHVGYNSDTLELTNIIAAFNTESSDRIMLCAHWDTRPRADKDSVRKDQPIPGADDGASGVAVLLEVARLLSNELPNVGVDIILFDGEDYGKEGDTDQYFLGSRYWAENPPVPGYRPRFGILLDIVGGDGAKFPKELNSMKFAPALVNEIWTIGEEKGFEEFFIDREGAAISDDHVIINRELGLPIINVIRHDPDAEELKFAPYWHTHRDNMDIISKETINAVGTVITELIYNRI